MIFFKKYKLEIILFLIALAAHFFFFFLLLTNYGPDSFYITSEDAREFFQIGKNLFQNNVFSNEINFPYYLNSFRTILYPLYLAFFQFFTTQAWLPIVFQNIIGALSVILAYKIGSLLINNRKIVFLAALFFALDPLQNYWSNIIEPDTILVFLVLLSIFYFIKYWQIKDNKYLIISAVFLGLAVLIKPIALYYPVFFCGFIFIDPAHKSRYATREITEGSATYARGKLSKIGQVMLRVKPITIFLLIFFAILFPWMARNWYHFKVFGISSITGTNLYRYSQEVGPDSEAITNYLNGANYRYRERDIRTQAVMKRLALKRILEHPVIFSKSQILGMIKFFIDDGHKEAYYLQHYKAMLFYNTPEPQNNYNITAELKKGNFLVISDVMKNLNQYMIIYLLSKIIYILGYLVVIYGLIKAYKIDKNLFGVFLLFIALTLYIALAAGPWGACVRYRLPVLPGLLLIFSYGIFHLPYIKLCGKLE